MALDRMSIISGGLFPTSPADTVERHEHTLSKGLFIDFPTYTIPTLARNMIFNLGKSIVNFSMDILNFFRKEF